MKLAQKIAVLVAAFLPLSNLPALAATTEQTPEGINLTDDFRGGMTAATRPGAEAMSLAREASENYRYDLALAHLRKAAELGNVEAQRTAGMMLLLGEVLYGPQVKRNRVEGVRLLQQAAGQGCATSKFVLAHLSAQGR